MGRDQNLKQLELKLERAGRQIVSIFQPAVPFVIQAAVSMGAYAAGLTAAQGVGSALRISCATPVAGPIGGILGVGFASALAGQASIKYQQIRVEGLHRAVLNPHGFFRTVRREDLIADAVLGIAFFRVMGGKFRSIMPSDLTKVGAIARESMPAAGMNYATDEKRRELARIFRRDGCHHCGKRSGPVIGDHMPPNKHVQETIDAAKRRFVPSALRRSPAFKQMMSALGVPMAPPLQRYYPQCRTCSQKQAIAVRDGKMHLVFHEVLHRGARGTAWHYAGVLVGARHYHQQSKNSNRTSNARRY